MPKDLGMHRVGYLVVGFIFSACSVFAQSPDAVAAGQKVYASQKCSICHAVAGVGNTRGVLDGVGSKLTADEIRQWIVDAPGMTAKTKAERKPPMRAYTTLSKPDVDALVAYMQSLKK